MAKFVQRKDLERLGWRKSGFVLDFAFLPYESILPVCTKLFCNANRLDWRGFSLFRDLTCEKWAEFEGCFLDIYFQRRSGSLIRTPCEFASPLQSK